MTAQDSDESSELERILRLSEEEEARALREELQSFLQSPAFRAELISILRDPLKDLIGQTLQSDAFTSTIRRQLLEDLQPPVLAAAKEAVKNAVKEIAGTSVPQWRDEVQRQVLDQLQSAVEREQSKALSKPEFANDVSSNVRSKVDRIVLKAVRDSVARLPGGWAEPINAAIQKAVEDAALAAADNPLPTPPTPAKKAQTGWFRDHWNRIAKKVRWGFAIAIAVIVFFAVIRVPVTTQSESRPTDKTRPQSEANNMQPPVRADTSHREQPATEPPAVFKNYLALAAIVSKAHKDIPSMNLQESQCIQQAVTSASRSFGRIDVDALHDALEGCSALQVVPKAKARSFVVAALQAHMANVKSCKEDTAIDGLAGSGTRNAVIAYVSCRFGETMNAEQPLAAHDYVRIALRGVSEEPPQ